MLLYVHFKLVSRAFEIWIIISNLTFVLEYYEWFLLKVAFPHMILWFSSSFITKIECVSLNFSIYLKIWLAWAWKILSAKLPEKIPYFWSFWMKQQWSLFISHFNIETCKFRCSWLPRKSYVLMKNDLCRDKKQWKQVIRMTI